MRHDATALLAASLRISQADLAGAIAISRRWRWRADCTTEAVRQEQVMALKALIATLILGTSSLALAGPFQREQRDEHRVREDRGDLRQDRRELRADERHGAGPREIRHDRTELRTDRQDLRRDDRVEARDRRFDRNRFERNHEWRRDRNRR
jgi:hypothetical protein